MGDGGWRLHEWGGALEWDDIERPAPATGEVLVEVEACSIGLTVLNYMQGNMANDPALLPVVPGHEYVGRVVGVGDGVDDELVGTRVGAYFYLSCGSCPSCSAGDESRCLRPGGRVGVHRDGGYAPYATLPAFNAIPVAESLPAAQATVICDAVATPVHVAALAAITPADRVVVVGAGGGVGIHMIQVAGLDGATVVGLEQSVDKLEAIEALGVTAVAVGDITEIDYVRDIGEPPTVAVDFVGTPDTLEWSLRSLTMGGRMVVVTTFPDRVMALNPRDLVRREARIIGSRYASRSQFARGARLVAEGAVEPVVGRTVAPAGVPSVHDDVRAGTLLGRGAVTWS